MSDPLSCKGCGAPCLIGDTECRACGVRFGPNSMVVGKPSPVALAKYIVDWLRNRNGGELAEAFGDMKLCDYEMLVGELELILKHGGKPPSWDK